MAYLFRIALAFVFSSALAEVSINGQPVSEQDFQNFPKLAVLEGHFWLDCQSGLWGMIGGPSMGQVSPQFKVNCDDMSDAVSDGKHDIFINGRSIHEYEYAYLMQLFGQVPSGRYWLDYQGIGGLEGQVQASFRIPLSPVNPKQQESILSGWGSEWAGNVIGDGETTGYIASEPGGISVTCGPDGGCIY